MCIEKTYDKTHFLSTLNSYSKNSNSIVTTFINPFSYYYIKDNDELYTNIDYIYIDGGSLVFLQNIFNYKKVDRVSFDFSSIAGDVIEYSSRSKLKVIFVGGNEYESSQAKINLSYLYPNDELHFINGYLESQTIINNLANFDVIILGMGCPLQDEIAIKVKATYPIGKLIYTCGGFISQTAQKGDYYYPIVKKLGLRWLQRFILHKHVKDRVLNDYPKFYIKYIRENIKE